MLCDLSTNIIMLIGPDGQNPRRLSRGSHVLGTKISLWQKKISIFQEQGSQRIAEKYARDCRNFAGGRRNTRRNLGVESARDFEVEREDVFK